MDTRALWFGPVLVSMATCAALAQGGVLEPVGEPSGAALAPDGGGGSLTRVALEGFVLTPDGSPAEGALVVSSAGGKAVTDVAGSYRLEVEVAPEATSVQVTAVGGAGSNLVASTSVALGGAARPTRVDPLALARGLSCSPSWIPTFGTTPMANGYTSALAVYDDGNGPALYVGGSSDFVGDVLVEGIARWDGSSWSALGSGMSGGSVLSLAVYDNGGGPKLYAAGTFTSAGGVPANRIAKWNGSVWSALGSGLNNSVSSLAVFDDGSGPVLYAGGRFTSAGGSLALRIAKWDGSSWSQLGFGIDGSLPQVYVDAFAVFDDGGGPALYVGGSFTRAGGVTACNHIAKWDGASWSRLGSGANGSVNALTVFDDGGGPALYVGGAFTGVGGSPAQRVAKWDGATWSALGSGMNDFVSALTVYDDGSGPALHAAGDFTTADGMPANRVAKWNGSGWSALGSGPGFRAGGAMAVYDDGGGPELFVGGEYFVKKWDGSSWSTLSTGIDYFGVYALAMHDDGSGPALYAGGWFGGIGGMVMNGIAKWDGTSWSPLGSGLNGPVYPGALTVYDDGGGPALYAGGNFTTAGGLAVNYIAKWNGASWSPLGGGMDGAVRSLAAFDDGGGMALYAGGQFTSAGGVAASRIAKWNGTSWLALGSGLSNSSNFAAPAMAVHDDGSGPALYVGGDFTTAGGVSCNRIARWDGVSWSPLGSGMNEYVYTLWVHDDGGGPGLYAGGGFTTAGGGTASHVAKWDGTSWSPLGTGTNGAVFELTTYDDGSGPALYACGDFTTAAGLLANRIAKWSGSGWTPLGSGMSHEVFAMQVYDDGDGPALFAGGGFLSAYDSRDSFLAKWGLDTEPLTLSCPSPMLVFDDFGGTPGEVVHFTVTASDCRDPNPVVVCVPPSGSVFPRGTTLVTCTATDASGNQATCEFPVTVALKARRR